MATRPTVVQRVIQRLDDKIAALQEARDELVAQQKMRDAPARATLRVPRPVKDAAS